MHTYVRTCLLHACTVCKYTYMTCVHTCYTEVIEKLQMMSSPIKSDLALGDLNMASMPVVSVPQGKYCTTYIT